MKLDAVLLYIALGVYVLGQTEVLRPFSNELWWSISAVISAAVMTRMRSLLSVRLSMYTVVFGVLTIAHSIIFYFLLQTQITGNEPLVGLLKTVLIILFLLFMLIQQDPVAFTVRASDITIVTTLAVCVLGFAGVIPSKTYAGEDMLEHSLGFANTNTAIFFLFMGVLGYIIAGRYRRLTAMLFVVVATVMAGSYSRTFLIATILSWLAVTGMRWRRFQGVTDWVCLIVAVVSGLIGFAVYSMPLLSPMFLESLIGGPLDILLSRRITVFAYSMADASDGLLGFTLSKIDSLYFEFIFILGFPFGILFLVQLIRSFRHRDIPLQRNIFTALTMVAISGLAETMLTTVTIGAILIWYFVLCPQPVPKRLYAAPSSNDPRRPAGTSPQLAGFSPMRRSPAEEAS